MNPQNLFGVDLLDTLEKIMKLNTEHYQSDFAYDRETIADIHKHEEPADQWFLWLSRKSGTHCFPEQNVFILDYSENNTWCYYADHAPDDSILAYAGNVTGKMNGCLIGNLFHLDYKAHVQYVKRNSFALAGIEYVFQDGYRCVLAPNNESHLAPMCEQHGDIRYRKLLPQCQEQFKEFAAERHKKALQTSPLDLHLSALKRRLTMEKNRSQSEPEL